MQTLRDYLRESENKEINEANINTFKMGKYDLGRPVEPSIWFQVFHQYHTDPYVVPI